MEQASVAFPERACNVLRMAHVDHEVTALWPSVRALLAGEHFHLLKAVDSAENDFGRVNPEGDPSLAYTETDTSSLLQFFDLRIANLCEEESPDEFPRSIDNP